MTANAAQRPSIRPALLDLIARAETAAPGDPISDEQYFLDQLRAAIASGESPIDRLRARYGGVGTDRLCQLYAKYPD